MAAAVASPIYEATVEKACRLIEEAAENGAKIIAFPEKLYCRISLLLLDSPDQSFFGAR